MEIRYREFWGQAEETVFNGGQATVSGQDHSGLQKIVILCGFLLLAGFLVLDTALPPTPLQSVPLHIIVESLGLFSGLALALFILVADRRELRASYRIWAASALIAMGLLDGFHSAVIGGAAAGWLHILAMIAGGLLFAIAGLDRSSSGIRHPFLLPAVTAVVTILLAVGILLFSEQLPPILISGTALFTPAVIAANLLAGILFIAGALGFLTPVRISSDHDDERIFFSGFCMLNGVAALVFPWSGAWTAGFWFWHLLRVSAYLLLLFLIYDIYRSLELRSERELRESAEKFHTMVDFTYNWEYWEGPDNRLIYVSPSCERITGYTSQEFMDDPGLIRRIIHPGDKKFMDQYFSRIGQEAGPGSVDFRILRRDGTVRWIVQSCQGVTTQDGQPAGWRMSNRDITDRKRAETALAQSREKLKVLNAITFTDIRSTVYSLSGYFELEKYELEQSKNPDEKKRKYLARQEALIRMIMDSLLFAERYQNLGISPPQWQDVQQSFLFAASHLDASGLSRTLACENLEIYADPLLENVFFTLVENVILHAKTATAMSLTCTVTSSGGLVILFEDNGAGIPADMKEKIFDRRYEEKKGVGLLLTREILSVTGITIHENGIAGQGARFEIAVPKDGYRFSSRNNAGR